MSILLLLLFSIIFLAKKIQKFKTIELIHKAGYIDRGGFNQSNQQQ